MEIKFFSVPWTQDGEDKFDMSTNKLDDILASDNCQFLGSCEGGITYTSSLNAKINIQIPKDFDIRSANYVYLPEKKEGWFLSDFQFMNSQVLNLSLEYDIWSNTFNWDCFLQTNAVNIQRQHTERYLNDKSNGYPMDFNQDTSTVFFRDEVVGQYGELGYVKEPVFPTTKFKTGQDALDIGEIVEDAGESAFEIVFNNETDTVWLLFLNYYDNVSIKPWNLTTYHIMSKQNIGYIDQTIYVPKIAVDNPDISINRVNNPTTLFTTNTDVQAKNVRKLIPYGNEYVAKAKLPYTIKFLRLDGSNRGVLNECVVVDLATGSRTTKKLRVDGTLTGTLDFVMSWSPDTSVWGSSTQATNMQAWRAATVLWAQKLIGGMNATAGYAGVQKSAYDSITFSPENNINAMEGLQVSFKYGNKIYEFFLYLQFDKPSYENLENYVDIIPPNSLEGNQKEYTTILDAVLLNEGTFKYKQGETWNYLNEPRIYLQDIMFDSFTANNLSLNIPLYMNLNNVRIKETIPVTNQEFSLAAIHKNTSETYPETNFNYELTTQQQTKRVGSNGNNSLPLLKDTYAQTMSRQQSQINNQEKWGVISGGVGAVSGSIAGMGMLGMGSAFYDHYLRTVEPLTREKAGGIMGMITGGVGGTIGSLAGGIVAAIRARDTKKAIIDDARRSPDDVFGQGGLIQINTSNKFKPKIYRRQLPDWAVQSLALYFHKYGYKAPETKILYRVLEYKRKNFNYFEIEGMGDACVLNQTFKEYYNALFSQGVRIWWDCRKKFRDYTLPNNEVFIEND